MPRLLEHGLRRTGRARSSEWDDRDHALAAPVVEVLHEYIRAFIVHEWKRIRIEAEARIGHHIPRRIHERARVPEVGSVHDPPTSPPMRGIATQVIEPPHHRPDEA